MTDPALYTDVLRLRALASRALAQLEEDILTPPESRALNAFYFGKNENALSVLTKLSQMLARFVPMEAKLASQMEEGTSEEEEMEAVQQAMAEDGNTDG